MLANVSSISAIVRDTQARGMILAMEACCGAAGPRLHLGAVPWTLWLGALSCYIGANRDSEKVSKICGPRRYNRTPHHPLWVSPGGGDHHDHLPLCP